jgi:glyoxylase-like metal-dependent hydrolase (beta-lactamase superfamily II)
MGDRDGDWQMNLNTTVSMLGRPSPTGIITDDLSYLRTGIVNVFFYGQPGVGDRGWVLIDTGIYGFSSRIMAEAAHRFGDDARPAAIILTHGHFDHVGAVKPLAKAWDVPVYAHPMEMPYLTDQSPYPPPDPTVGGGAMSALSPLYPRGPFKIEPAPIALPSDGSVPGMPGWRWVHTPGHAPGHVALYRESDRTLIAGDAFVTTRQESLSGAYTQQPEMHGPPMYFTPDWQAARRSVETLAALEPQIAATGHGLPMAGDILRDELHALARHFDHVAVPDHGRYVHDPAITDRNGIVSVPDAPDHAAVNGLLAFGLAAIATMAIVSRSRR